MSIRFNFESVPNPERVPEYTNPEFKKGSISQKLLSLLEDETLNGLYWRPIDSSSSYIRAIEWKGFNSDVKLTQVARVVRGSILKRPALEHSSFKLDINYGGGQAVAEYNVSVLDSLEECVTPYYDLGSGPIEYRKANEKQKMMLLSMAILYGDFAPKCLVHDRPPVPPIDK